MLPDKLTFHCFTERSVGLIPLVIGLAFGFVTINFMFSINVTSPADRWYSFFGFLSITILLLGLSFSMFWLTRTLTIANNHYRITFELLGIVLYRREYPVADYQFIYSPKEYDDAEDEDFGLAHSVTTHSTPGQQTDDTGACWLINNSDYNKRLKIGVDYLIAKQRKHLHFKNNEAFLSAVFKKPCVHNYDQVAGLAGEIEDLFIDERNAAGKQAATSDSANSTTATKPKGGFKLVSNSDGGVIKLFNPGGIYIGCSISAIFILLMLFGAIPSSGLLFVLIFGSLTSFRETITLTPEKIETSVRFLFIEIESTSLPLDQITAIRTQPSKLMGNDMVILELLSHSNNTVRLPLGVTGRAGIMMGLSRQTMAEALWLSKNIKARLPEKDPIKILDEGLWD